MKQYQIIFSILVLLLSGCGRKQDVASQPSKTPDSSIQPKAEETETTELLAPEVVEIGGGRADGNDYVYYAARVYNPNETMVMYLPRYTVSLRDAEGKVIGVDENVTKEILPQDTVTVVGMVDASRGTPTQIEMEVVCTKDRFRKEAYGIAPEVFSFHGVSLYPDGDTISLVGEVLNNSPYLIDGLAIYAVFRRENKIVYADSTFTSSCKPGNNPFELRSYMPGVTFDTVELYAYDNGTQKEEDTTYTPVESVVNENVISYSMKQNEEKTGSASGDLTEQEETTPPTNDSNFEAFKETMDSYEAFFDDYVEFMKSYNASDLSMLTKYAQLMSQYAEMMRKVDEIDTSTLTEQEYAYYIEVMARIQKKLLEL